MKLETATEIEGPLSICWIDTVISAKVHRTRGRTPTAYFTFRLTIFIRNTKFSCRL